VRRAVPREKRYAMCTKREGVGDLSQAGRCVLEGWQRSKESIPVRFGASQGRAVLVALTCQRRYPGGVLFNAGTWRCDRENGGANAEFVVEFCVQCRSPRWNVPA
jgi:hypothetical protein